MDIDKLPPGENPPDNVNVIIEIPVRSDPVKYEFDKDTGFIFVDRMLSVSMHYPCNYGFIPKTLAADGDPVDALVLADLPVIPGAVIECRPVGVMIMEDEAGMDEKLLCAPLEKIAPQQAHIKEPDDIPDLLLQQITHFFQHYKDLEPGKWAKPGGIAGSDHARELIMEGIAAYKP